MEARPAGAILTRATRGKRAAGDDGDHRCRV